MKNIVKAVAVIFLTVAANGGVKAADCSNNALGGNWVCIQSKSLFLSQTTSVSSATLAYTTNVGGSAITPHLLTFSCFWSAVQCSASTDTLNTVFTCAAPVTGSDSGGQICWGLDTASGPDIITFNFNVPVTNANIHIYEFSGNAASNVIDTSTSNSGNTNSIIIPASSITTSATDELLFTCATSHTDTDPWTAGTDMAGNAGTYTLFSYAVLSGSGASGCEVLANVAAGAHNSTAHLNMADTWSASMVAFRSASQRSITISWIYNQGTDAAVGFNVYRAGVSGGPYTKLNAAPISIALDWNYTDSTTSAGIYFYAITAVDAQGTESAYSNEISSSPTGPSSPLSGPAVIH